MLKWRSATTLPTSRTGMRVRWPVTIIGVLARLAVYATMAPTVGSVGPGRGETFTGAVTRVIEGDTFWLAGL